MIRLSKEKKTFSIKQRKHKGILLSFLISGATSSADSTENFGPHRVTWSTLVNRDHRLNGESTGNNQEKRSYYIVEWDRIQGPKQKAFGPELHSRHCQCHVTGSKCSRTCTKSTSPRVTSSKRATCTVPWILKAQEKRREVFDIHPFLSPFWLWLWRRILDQNLVIR